MTLKGNLFMLTDLQAEKIFIELSLPSHTCSLIRSIRSSGPVREPTNHFGNSNPWLFSKKMGGIHLKLESRTVESSLAVLHEFDDDVLEYWPQPHRMSLSLIGSDGKLKTKTLHIPDFLVIRHDSIGFVECREESRLLNASKENNQFFKDAHGDWHYRAAEDYANSYHLTYRIISSMQIPYRLTDNRRFLADYLRPDCPPLSAKDEMTILELFQLRPCIPYQELVRNQGFCADSVLKAITMQLVYVDLINDRLDRPDELIVYRDSSVARATRLLKQVESPPLPIPGMGRLKAGTTVQFDSKNYTVELVGANQVLMRTIDGSCTSIALKDIEDLFGKGMVLFQNNEAVDCFTSSLADFSKEQLSEAVERMEAINGSKEKIASNRTITRWKAKIKSATTNLEKLKSLISNSQQRGNRNARLINITEEVALEAIELFYNVATCRTALGVYQKYVEICGEKDCEPMSYVTFCKRVKARESTREREGKKKDYQESKIPLFLDYRNPLHGLYPHEVCYIDHTILPIATQGTNGADLGKPVFTFGVDGCATRARAMYLSYDPPSARVVLMTLRDYVRRNGRLPKVLVVDGGKEFRSAELAFFCQLFEIDLRHRPPGMPRGGTVVERAMGYTETELIAQLEGNTRIMRNVRMVTKDVEPYQFRCWTLTALWGALDELLFTIRDNRTHPTLGVSPRAFEEKRIIETGIREHTFVRFDEDLLLLTCPHPKNRFRIIDRIRGVWADNMYYWHDDFRSAKSQEKVEVRIEPWNANVIYVYYRTRWVAAIARDLRGFGRRTRYEVELALREERRLAKIEGNKARVSRLNCIQMAGLWVPTRFDPRISNQQSEMASLYEGIGMGVARKTTELAPVPAKLIKNIISQETITAIAPATLTQTGDLRPSMEHSEIPIETDCKRLEIKCQKIDFWKDVDGYI